MQKLKSGILGYKFRRQYWIKRYIVDFICIEKKLIIEIDGSQHMENEKYDENRTKQLSTLGFKVIRFWNNEVYEHINEVMDVIYQNLKHPHPLYKHLLPQAGEGEE
jgi:very-short-patch-repair endonuclease